jgi:hypothetical protein
MLGVGRGSASFFGNVQKRTQLQNLC